MNGDLSAQFFLEQEQQLALASELNLKDLVQDAGAAKSRIFAKPRAGQLYVLDAFEGILLVEQTAEKYWKFIEKKGPVPTDLRSLVRRSGGLRRTIQRLRDFLEPDTEPSRAAVKLKEYYGHGVRCSWASCHEEVSYVSCVLSCCLDAMDLTGPKRSLKIPGELPFCALCWRLPQNSRYYCAVHHPSRSEHFYNSAKTSLFRAIEDSGGEHASELAAYRSEQSTKGRIAKLMYKWAGAFASKPGRIRTGASGSQTPWRVHASQLVEQAGKHYPQAFQKIRRVDPTDYPEPKLWSLAVVEALGPEERTAWINAAVLDGFEHYIELQLALVAGVLYRFESTEYVRAFPQPRGPKSGSLKNLAVEREVIRIAREAELSGTKLSNPAIGKLVGRSGEYVRRVLKAESLTLRS